MTIGPGTQCENRNLLCVFKQPYKGKELNLLCFWMWMVLISQKETIREITNIHYLICQLKDHYLKSLGLQSRRNSNYVLSWHSLDKNKMERFLVKYEDIPSCQKSTQICKRSIKTDLNWVWKCLCVISWIESVKQWLEKWHVMIKDTNKSNQTGKHWQRHCLPQDQKACALRGLQQKCPISRRPAFG